MSPLADLMFATGIPKLNPLIVPLAMKKPLQYTNNLSLPPNLLQLPTSNQPRLNTRKFTPIVRTTLSCSTLIKHLLHTLELLLLLLVLLLLLDTRVPHALLTMRR